MCPQIIHTVWVTAKHFFSNNLAAGQQVDELAELAELVAHCAGLRCGPDNGDLYLQCRERPRIFRDMAKIKEKVSMTLDRFG